MLAGQHDSAVMASDWSCACSQATQESECIAGWWVLEDWPRLSTGVVACPASVNGTALQSVLKWAYNCCLSVPGEAVEACQALCRAANLNHLAEQLGREAKGQGETQIKTRPALCSSAP